MLAYNETVMRNVLISVLYNLGHDVSEADCVCVC